MNSEIVSKKTRNEFREFLVGWTLREIEMEFSAVYIDCDRHYDPQLSGQRRSLVEQYYHTLDFANLSHIRRLLVAYENILYSAEQRLSGLYDKTLAEQSILNLVSYLKKDGFKYYNGKITPITPEARQIFEDSLSGHTISEVTRRNIFDALRKLPNFMWSGRLSENDFLSRLYDIDSMPSQDHRFKTAMEDIWQHRINNPEDWPDDWIFNDPRFDLLHASDEVFLRFLCEMLHPVVRPINQDVVKIRDSINEHLSTDGWEITACTQISGKPVYAARRKIIDGSLALGSVKPIIEVLNAEYITQQMTRMEASIVSDPELAIGTAKEFIETISKTILLECGESVPANANLPQLVKQVRNKLELLPENISDKAKGAEIIKRILSNLGTVTQGLAELRGLYGSGHGKNAKVKGLQTRHARLAVNAACTLAVFLFETYQERKRN